jgi:hypothetical protein
VLTKEVMEHGCPPTVTTVREVSFIAKPKLRPGIVRMVPPAGLPLSIDGINISGWILVAVSPSVIAKPIPSKCTLGR